MSIKNKLSGVGVKLLVLVTSLTLTLLLLEGLVRLVGLESASYSSISGFCRYDPHLGWDLIPDNRTVFKGRSFAAMVETTSQGLRDHYYPLEPQPDRERILVLGDSVAWCWGVPIEECFTKRIERALPDTDVITMGVPGYSTAQSMLFYERVARRFHPDRVLFVAVGNDPVENLDGRKRPRFLLEDGGLVLTNYPVPRRKSRLKQWLRNHSRLYVQLDHVSQVAQEMRRQWKDRQSGKELGAQPDRAAYALATQDQLDEGWTLLEALLARFHDGVTSDGARFDLVTVDNPGWFTERMVEFCSTRGCSVLDFDSILRGADAEGPSLRLGADPHLSAEGNRVLAQALLRFLGEPPLAGDAAIR